MDGQFEVGGFKFGLDPILNLIPFALVMLLLGGFFFRLGLLSKHGRN
jgi:hypothetical protein